MPIIRLVSNSNSGRAGILRKFSEAEERLPELWLYEK
jgi:hypothetical protein